MNRIIIFSLIMALPAVGCNEDLNREVKDAKAEDHDMQFILTGWCDSFIKKVDSDYNAVVNFTLEDKDKAYHILIDDKQYIITDGINEDANFGFEASLSHYNRIYRGEITGFTSMGRASMSDSTPLNPSLHRPVTDELMSDFMFFTQRFFNSSPHDKVILGKSHSRVVHGGHAIPVFYRNNDEIGVRSAWYQVNKGQQLNEPGDTNPFPQYFIITRGEGFAKIANDTLRVKENEAYYIDPGEDHVFWTESEAPMEMIFLAWGEGA